MLVFGKPPPEKPIEAERIAFCFGGSKKKLIEDDETKTTFCFGGSNKKLIEEDETKTTFGFGGSKKKRIEEDETTTFGFGGSKKKRIDDKENVITFGFGGADYFPFGKRNSQRTTSMINRDFEAGFGSGLRRVEPLERFYDRLCRYSSLAIVKYNSEHNTNYEFVKYVKATFTPCAGFHFYITFEAREEGDVSPTTFHALVYEGIPDGEDENVHLDLVIKKSDYDSQRAGYSRGLCC